MHWDPCIQFGRKIFEPRLDLDLHLGKRRYFIETYNNHEHEPYRFIVCIDPNFQTEFEYKASGVLKSKIMGPSKDNNPYPAIQQTVRNKQNGAHEPYNYEDLLWTAQYKQNRDQQRQQQNGNPDLAGGHQQHQFESNEPSQSSAINEDDYTMTDSIYIGNMVHRETGKRYSPEEWEAAKKKAKTDKQLTKVVLYGNDMLSQALGDYQHEPIDPNKIDGNGHGKFESTALARYGYQNRYDFDEYDAYDGFDVDQSGYYPNYAPNDVTFAEYLLVVFMSALAVIICCCSCVLVISAVAVILYRYKKDRTISNL